MNRFVALLGAGLVLAPGAVGLGQVPSTPPDARGAAPSSQAERQYEQAQEHYKARRYTEALALFRKLTDEQGSPNARLYVARCLREMGQLAEAYEQMDRTARDAAARASAEPRFASTRDAAQAELAQLRSRVGFVELRPSSQPDGLEIEVNGRVLSPSALGAPVPVLPESVRIHASAPGYLSFQTELLVAAGSSVLVPIVLHPSGGAAPATAPAPSAPVHTGGAAAPPTSARPGGPPAPVLDETDADGTSGLVVGGIVFVGLGVIGWVTLAVAGTMANDRFDDIERACGGQRCTDPALNDTIDEGRILDIVANAGLGTGVVSFALAGVLFAVELARSDEPAATAAPSTAQVRLGAWGSLAQPQLGLVGTF